MTNEMDSSSTSLLGWAMYGAWKNVGMSIFFSVALQDKRQNMWHFVVNLEFALCPMGHFRHFSVSIPVHVLAMQGSQIHTHTHTHIYLYIYICALLAALDDLGGEGVDAAAYTMHSCTYYVPFNFWIYPCLTSLCIKCWESLKDLLTVSSLQKIIG